MEIVINKTTIIIVGKHVKTQFITTWTLIIIKEVGDKFHKNFQTCLQIDPCKYMGANLGCTTWVQQQVKQQARGCQIVRLLPSND